MIMVVLAVVVVVLVMISIIFSNSRASVLLTAVRLSNIDNLDDIEIDKKNQNGL